MRKFDFRKSSHSDHDHECVEVATNLPDVVAIRDSKRPTEPIVRISLEAWESFNAALSRGELR
ncbi:DUF397 domain-containing protein [Streptomyces sp. NPDC003077]|uniref:DUF397 domain-containing protein n=1 Tax=Streptomyces sp. NPDC003077 TaxID=3154443 RepID=UPI0033B49605